MTRAVWGPKDATEEDRNTARRIGKSEGGVLLHRKEWREARNGRILTVVSGCSRRLRFVPGGQNTQCHPSRHSSRHSRPQKASQLLTSGITLQPARAYSHAAIIRVRAQRALERTTHFTRVLPFVVLVALVALRVFFAGGES